MHTPCTLLLGGFDGFHVGHRTLYDAAEKFGAPIALTSMSGGKNGGDIFTFCEREILYEKQGISFVYELAFTEEFRNTSAGDFVQEIERAFSPRAVVCGTDFRFGKGAAGDSTLLKSLLSCPVEVCELKHVGGEKVSSSSVKKYLSDGAMSEVNALLAHDYFVHGRVEHGRKVGQGLGFPTVNLPFPTSKHPLKEGVYGGYAVTEQGRFPAVINFGARPTFGVAEQKLEAYLDGFSGDLYGTDVMIFPTEFYRPITKFERIDDLKEQIAKDIKRLRR